ncbi:guanine deaminase [Curvibacter sp. APW13]|uniref:guanine deaminase n=1 Tax=Curvibacter sp. APW13 TaxID=3077236 RepID=UPI0028DFFC58|nr:guanine deaminase [Curvibacter sp. APW13]MDT8991116.1 guanine deaminase [Curvibacter sp. APW13]
MKAFRSRLLWFPHGAAQACLEDDGLLVLERHGCGHWVVRAVGAWQALHGQFADVPTEHLPGRIIAPGFVDLHIHFPQANIIGSPADGLLPWLENYTFPEESRYADPAYSTRAAEAFVDELVRNGVTTAVAFATSHPHSVQALNARAFERGLRLVSGLVLMDRNAPDYLLNPSSGAVGATEQSLRDTESLIQQWHGKGRIGYAITPRFAPTSSEAQLRGAGELAAQFPDVWIQSHVSENRDEIAWVRELFPKAHSYLGVYEHFGLMRRRALYAHCIHFDDYDRAMMRDHHAGAAVSPTSNLFLGSGFFDFVGADRVGFHYGLASDVGGGTSFSPFHTMLAAYYVGREGMTKQGLSLSPQHLWWQHTAGAGQAMGLCGDNGEAVVGNLVEGADADFVVLNPQATPLLARKTAGAQTLDELLFSLIVLGDDRVIERTHLASV